jgi:type IV pilus assembly protein PilC
MALLIASRVPILRSIQLVREMITYYPLQEGLKKVEESILKGKSLYESMDKIPVFDHKLRSMIKVAEETNETAYIFKRLNKQYHSDLQQKSKMLSTVLEPFIILFVGVIVAVILIAMYLPMFKLSSVLG